MTLPGFPLSSDHFTGGRNLYDSFGFFMLPDILNELEAAITAAGSADVTGPVSSTNNAVTRFDLATGKVIKNSLVLIDDTGNITLPGGATIDGVDVSTIVVANIPSAGQKAALAGSSGTPGAGNTFVTQADSRFKRETVRIFVPGALGIAAGQGGIWEAPAAGSVVRATAYLGTTGSVSGATTVDVLKNGATILDADLSVAYNAPSHKATKTTGASIPTPGFAAGDIYSVDVDGLDGGPTAADLTVVLTVEYSG